MKTLLFIFVSAIASAQYFPPSGGGGGGATGTCPQWQYVDAISSVAITCNPSGTDTGLGNGVVASGGGTFAGGNGASATACGWSAAATTSISLVVVLNEALRPFLKFRPALKAIFDPAE